MDNKTAYAQLYLRIALGGTFLLLGLDRLGFWGPYGRSYVSWGDWSHFTAYAHQVMAFLPDKLIDIFAVLATMGEIGFGFLLLIGWFTRLAAIGSGLLTLGFSISMAVSFGITSPVNYSVFTVSAASFLLSVIPYYRWSIDSWRSSIKK